MEELAGRRKTPSTALQEPRLWRLTIHAPDQYAEVFLVPGQVYTIGRSQDNPIMVNDLTVSRLHATLTVYPDRVVIEDNDSKNGTFVQNQRITGPYELVGFEDVRIGRVILVIEPVTTGVERIRVPTETTPNGEVRPYASTVQALHEQWRLVESLLPVWQDHIGQDPDQAMREVLHRLYQRHLFRAFILCQRSESDRLTLRMAIPLQWKPDPNLMEWALRSIEQSPQVQVRQTDEDAWVVVFPVTAREAMMLWLPTTAWTDPTLLSTIPLLQWLLREWTARRAFREDQLLARAAWAPFPFWGFSPETHRVLRQALAAAQTTAPLAIVGPEGTGRAVLARWIHDLSRPHYTFRIWSVADLDDPLSQSLQESAVVSPEIGWPLHRGTVVLQSLPRTPLEFQRRVFDWVMHPVIDQNGVKQPLDIRWILITDRSLEELQTVEMVFPPLAALFRSTVIEVPALIQRAGDLPYLVHHLVEQLSRGRIRAVAESAMTRLIQHTWPGNLPELTEVLKRAVDRALRNLEPDRPGILQETHLKPDRI